MRQFARNCFLVLVLVNFAYGFYFSKNQNEASEHLQMVDGFQIVVNEQNFESFPSTFQVNYNGMNSQFAKIESSDSRDIYVINQETGQPMKYKLNEVNDEFEHYIQKDGNGLATLIKNAGSETNQFRMIGTVYSDNEAYEIVPVNSESSKRSANEGFDSLNNNHAIVKRKVANNQDAREVVDFIASEPKNFQDKIFKEMDAAYNKDSKRSLNGQPIALTVEMLVVTDITVYNIFKASLNSVNNDVIFASMRVYYAHLLKLVDKMYKDSLATDADLRVSVVLTNFLFLTAAADCAWLDVTKVGLSGFTSFEGRDVVVASPTLNAFIAYMNAKTFSFKYDHAVALFNKDIFSDTGSTVDDRKGVVGFAPVTGICTDRRYSIVEDKAAFDNVGVIAHELGHNLGSNHDGSSSAAGCPSSYNYIMSPSPSNTNLLNQYIFSPCSIFQFKKALLNSGLSGTSTQAQQCLTNTPTSVPPENTIANGTPGLVFTSNDQCNRKLGGTGSLCFWKSDEMCSSLWCKDNNDPGSCTTNYGGALAGTVCGSGKMCVDGKCVASTNVPASVCPFGDDVVSDAPGVTLPKASVTCKEAFDLMISKGVAVADFCAQDYYSKQCCFSCLKYKQQPVCQDKYSNCYQFASSCSSTATFSNGEAIATGCPKTCKKCSNVVTCKDSTFVCQNGGTCVSATTNDPNVQFKCNCKPGFSGEICEKRDPCANSPCLNGGTCSKFGSEGFVCACAKNYSGATCSKYL